MSRRQRRPKQEVFAFESSKGENDKFAKIYASMLQSPAWKNLTKPQQILYVYMKLQFRSETREKVPDKPDICFYFNQTLWKKTYGLYTNTTCFYKDRNALIQNGFIELEESGRNTRTRSVYRLSYKWQDIPP